MSRHQQNKARVANYWAALDGQSVPGLRAVLAEYLHPEHRWHGFAPINRLDGIDALLEAYWQPLLASFGALRRRTDILIAGHYGGKDWVSATGYLRGTFQADWLGIPATGEETLLRFGTFHALHEGQITETYILLDVLDVMRQAGIHVLPPSNGAEGIVPPPSTGDGVQPQSHAAAEGQTTYDLVYAMLFQGLNEFDQSDKASMGMVRYWSPGMHWYGPQGIGTSHGLDEFERFHQMPFLTAFPDRKATEQEALIADGHYAAASGFPGVVATHSGPYLGEPASQRRIDMRVMDWWRREGDLLMENWVLIDLIDIFLQAGVDLLARLQEQRED